MSTVVLQHRTVAARPRPAVGALAWLPLAASCLGLVAAMATLGAWRLGSIPGFNGDEAWGGAQAVRWLTGQEVAWKTPNGNPLNPFFFLPLVGLHLMFEPSVALVRSVALASGLAALVVNFAFCRQVCGSRDAVVSTMLLAALPINIAYSRFGWDASQSLLATTCVLYLPLLAARRRGAATTVPAAGVVALAAAVVVHPTNVFAAPLLVAPLVWVRGQEIIHWLRNVRCAASASRLLAIVAGAAAAAYATWLFVVQFGPRLHGPSDLPTFALDFWRLFSGTTVYEYIAGLAGPSASDMRLAWLPWAIDGAWGLLGVAAAWGMVNRLRAAGDGLDAWVTTGWAATVAGFFLVAGPDALAPHRERYGLCLIAPTVLVAARGLGWWLERPGRGLAVAALAVLPWTGPASFVWGYFDYMLETGGRSHPTFRVAVDEPKQMALEAILAVRQGEAPVRIVCGEYWNYWPLAYLAHRRHNVQVLTAEAWRDARAVGPAGAEDSGETWFVEFAGSPGETAVAEALAGEGILGVKQYVCDTTGRPLLAVFGPVRPGSENY